MKKQGKSFTARDYILFGIIAVALFFARDTSNEIINYPDYLTHCLWLAIGILIVVLRFRRFEAAYLALAETGERLSYAAISLIATAVGALTLACILLVPFNYYNVHIARQHAADTIRCPIEDVVVKNSITTGPQPDFIYYHFQGKDNSIKTDSDAVLIANMHALHAYSRYQLKLVVHKALLGSYWLETWEIEGRALAAR